MKIWHSRMCKHGLDGIASGMCEIKRTLLDRVKKNMASCSQQGCYVLYLAWSSCKILVKKIIYRVSVEEEGRFKSPHSFLKLVKSSLNIDLIRR